MQVREDTQSSLTDRSHRNLEARSDVMDLSRRNHRACPYSPRKLLGAVLGPETSPSQHYSIISKP